MEMHHDCTGEDCPICSVIELCAESLKQLANTVAAVILFISSLVFICKGYCLSISPICCKTPIALKIRLNN